MIPGVVKKTYRFTGWFQTIKMISSGTHFDFFWEARFPKSPKSAEKSGQERGLFLALYTLDPVELPGVPVNLLLHARIAFRSSRILEIVRMELPDKPWGLRLGGNDMITVRRSTERRIIASDAQTTWMTFDWENKADPLQKGFGALKIFNEEQLSPGRAFILHTHKDMVVVTYVHEGVVICNGPLGKNGLMEPGDFLQVNATLGSKQYTLNASPSDDARVFQSGFTPAAGVLEPNGEKKLFTLAERKGILRLIASPDGKEASLKIQQDVQMYSTLIHKGNHMIHELKPGRKVWLHVVKGGINLGGLQLQAGDGAGFAGENAVSFTAQGPTEILLFDLA